MIINHCNVLFQRGRTNSNTDTEWLKKLAHFLYALTSYDLTSSNIYRYSNLFESLNQANICNNTVTKDPIRPQVCRYTTLWNITVLTATTENKTTSITTQFKSASSSNKMDTLTRWTRCDS